MTPSPESASGASGPATDTEPMIRTTGLVKEFNGFRAVGGDDGVALEVDAGTLHALVGPNGAGKTTLFNLLTGFLAPSAGRIVIGGTDVTGMPPEQIARRGVARSFQITSLFEELSLLQHVELALQGRSGQGYRFWQSDKRLSRFGDEAHDLLGRVGLDRLARRPAGTLSYGQKRALELALALALSPQLLLLDEPTAGMGVEDIARTIDLIARVREDRTVVLVEHNMKVVGSLADRVTVLQFGQVLAEGPYQEVRADPRVITAYLGESVA
ncbi:MAG TPA: ABC transporter ATP-binding protein [Nocardioidaceae bacterium]|nr:ABC transporter ATP-binding protein [Nocardioidaceae bacterium]